ncbi:polyprenyl synthetase family protein [Streptomyces sp. NPDC026673]|uniref:polyprenyl synthetase family protein n=1 Tax=Streptomyces sp. NPDC026673 TaxID=3155724 RepID=UPI0033C6DC52
MSSELDRLSEDHPSLAAGVARLVASDGSVNSPFRLLAFPVLGALTSALDPALPVVVISRLWWAGAETFDDLADADFDEDGAGLSNAQAGIASAACLSVVPQMIIERQSLPDRLKAAWTWEFNAGSVAAAEGQFRDVSAAEEPGSWAATMRIYARKSGAPYGRDAAMTAMLAGADDEGIRGWRMFGLLFGVLRQMANDRASIAVAAEEDEDLANGTWTLLLAHAMEDAGAREAQTLGALHTRVKGDVSARSELRRRLVTAEIAAGYDRRVEAVQRKLLALLKSLAEPSDQRDLIQWMVDVSAADSLLSDLAGAA